MRKSYRNFLSLAGVALAVGMLPLAASADATIESVTHFDGIMGMAASDIHTVSQIQGMKERRESSVKFKGAILGALQSFSGHKGGSKDIEIYRIDKDLQWRLDPANKRYSEQSISTPPEAVQQREQERQANKEQSGDKHKMKVVKNEVKVKDTGKTETVNGFKAHEYVITWYVEAVDEDTGKHSKSLMTSDVWASTDHGLSAVQAEQTKFNVSLMEKKHEMVSAMMGKQYGFGAIGVLGAASPAKFGKALEQIKGLPVRTNVTWEASGQPEQGGGDDKQAAEQAKAKAALAKLGSLFGGHSEPKKPEKDSAHPGMTKVFSSSTDVLKVSTDKLSASTFQIPAGYHKD